MAPLPNNADAAPTLMALRIHACAPGPARSASAVLASVSLAARHHRTGDHREPLVFQRLGIPLHWWSSGLAVHVMWTLPFSLIIFLMFFNRFDSSLEDAALTLGATRWQTFRNVTFPVMQPAVLTSLLFASPSR
jgi:ABC-type Fe3+ transport system permease subunit